MTPPTGREHVAVPFAVVQSLVLASSASSVTDDDLGPTGIVEALLDIGAIVPVHDDPAPRPARAWSSQLDGTDLVAPVPPEAHLWPAGGFVGRLADGALVVEGEHGRQLLLDDIDLGLIDGMVERSGRSAGETVATFAEHHASLCGDHVELRRRLARLGAVGVLRWYPEAAPAPETPARAAPAPAPVALDATAAPLGEVVREVGRRVRYSPFPGRPVLARAYAGARDLLVRRSSPGRHAGSTLEQRVESTKPIEQIDAHEPAPAAPSRYVDDPRVGPHVEGRIPVYAPYMTEFGPVLSLAMLTANARQAHDGALGEHYEIRRIEDPDSMLADLAGRPGPAVVLLSNYMWSYDHNLEVARRAVALDRGVVVVHGGPHTPKYDADCRAFFDDHADVVHVTVRGEGEVTLVEVLRALVDDSGVLDVDRLEVVPGISYRSTSSGEVVTTEDRDRIDDLDQLPSPYLTGELDHLAREAFNHVLTFESNRGCPYGCTFCDWGSMTLSRIRRFELDRVVAEMRWAAERGLDAWVLADANLGIMARDVELVEAMVELRAELGVPTNLGFNVAKNTTKHLTAIMSHLVTGGIAPHVSLALQTSDADTLEAIRRTNIHTEHYVALAADFRRRGLPLQADVMLGLPGQTVDSITADLEFLVRHDISARVWVTHLLPNAPMNDPEYRAQYGVVADERGIVIETSSYTSAERQQMKRLRHAHAVFDRYGLLRHVARHLLWDHDVAVMDTYGRALELADSEPARYPLLSWCMHHFDHFPLPPLGWRSFYDEVRRFVVTELDVPFDSALETVLRVQEHLMPVTGRHLPASAALQHDYVAYFRDAVVGLWTTGAYEPPVRKLADYGAATFVVNGDRLDRCGLGMQVRPSVRNDRNTDEFWMSGHFELDSPLVVPYADIASSQRFTGRDEQLAWAATLEVPEVDDLRDEATGIEVRLGGVRGSGARVD